MHVIQNLLLGFVVLSTVAPAQQVDNARIQPGTPASTATSYKPSWVWWPSRTVPRDQPYVPLTGKQRLDLLVRGSFLNPGSWARASFAAGIDHLQNDPPQWGSNTDGFEKRLLDRYAAFAIRDGIESAWAGVIGHEVRYIPSTSERFSPRLLHAIAGGFRTYNSEGKWRPHYSRVGASFGAAYIRYTWEPARERDASELAYETLLQLAVNSSGRVYREFSPEINKVLFGWMKKKDKPATPASTPSNTTPPRSESKPIR